MLKNFLSIICLIILVSLASCKSMKFSFAERTTTKNSEQQIELVKNQLIVPTLLEGKEQRLMLDLGASTCVIYDTSVINNYYQRDKSSFGSARGAGSGKIGLVQLPLSINDSLFSSHNKVFTVIDNSSMRSKDDCDPGVKFVGLYGRDLFKNNKTILLLDLQGKKLCNVTDKTLTNLLRDGYQEIKSKFNMWGTTVYVTINGKEYPFGFDTGFNGTFTMPADNNAGFVNEPHISYEGMAAITVTGIEKGLTDIYQGKEISFNGTKLTSTITVSSTIKVQNMGMAFMKGFNWIVDYKHKKIYSKRLTTEESLEMKFAYNYVPKILNNKLIVVLRKSGMTDYDIGDEIISVNGEAVDDHNKCELLQVLIKNSDWKTLNVKTQQGDLGKAR